MSIDLQGLKSKAMKPLKWCTKKSESDYMRKRQAQNRALCVTNGNENWMAAKLETTGMKWTRQAWWGYRLFDFWNATLGIAVEVDGPEHDKAYDAHRDEYNFRRSGILVLRVRNLSEDDATRALDAIANAEPWKERRQAMGLHKTGRKARRQWVTAPGTLL